MTTERAIRELRKTMGLSREQFAHEVGATGRTIQRWEQGSEPTPGNLTGLISAAKQAGRSEIAVYFTKLKEKAVSKSVATLASPRSARRIPHAELENIKDVIKMVDDEMTSGDIKMARWRLAYIDDWLNSWLGVMGTLRGKRK